MKDLNSFINGGYSPYSPKDHKEALTANQDKSPEFLKGLEAGLVFALAELDRAAEIALFIDQRADLSRIRRVAAYIREVAQDIAAAKESEGATEPPQSAPEGANKSPEDKETLGIKKAPQGAPERTAVYHLRDLTPLQFPAVRSILSDRGYKVRLMESIEEVYKLAKDPSGRMVRIEYREGPSAGRKSTVRADRLKALLKEVD